MWDPLVAGDSVDIIAPASGMSFERLERSISFLKEWGLVPRVSSDIFDSDLLYANSDEFRFKDLSRALYSSDSKAVWCIRGGSGCTRLIPKLLDLTPPQREKIFIGFSDITCLQIFMHQKWGWSPIHGPSLSQVAENTISPDSVKAVKDLVFGHKAQIELRFRPLNKAARENIVINSMILGGNLSLVQCSIGTPWQIETKGKILFLEEVNERPYRVAERFEHLRQASILEECAVILLGEFIAPQENRVEQEVFTKILQKFANEQNIPVLACESIGHGSVNMALPIGSSYQVSLGEQPILAWSRS